MSVVDEKAVPITSMTAARDGDLVEAAPLPPSTGRGLVGPRAGSTVASGHMEMGLDFHWPARATASSGVLATTASGLTTRSTNPRGKFCLGSCNGLRLVGDLCCLMLNQTNRLLHSTTRQDVECDCRRRDLCRVEKDVIGPLGPGFGERDGAKLEFLGIAGLVLLRPARHGDNQALCHAGLTSAGSWPLAKTSRAARRKSSSPSAWRATSCHQASCVKPSERSLSSELEACRWCCFQRFCDCWKRKACCRLRSFITSRSLERL